MLGTALYYPFIDITDSAWLKSAILFWDEIQTIAPTSIHEPYQTEDTKICAEEGYLSALRCDLHHDVLEDLGRRVIKLIDEPDDFDLVTKNQATGYALMHANKIGKEARDRMNRLVGLNPDKISPDMRAVFFQNGGLEFISVEKMDPHLAEMMMDYHYYRMHPEKISRMLRRHVAHNHENAGNDWLLVNGHFAATYMAAMAALLADRISVSPLTDHEISSGVNLRCLLDDVTSNSPSAARGALVSVVMEGIRINPETKISKILKFRRKRRDQLAELAGQLDKLKSGIENFSDSRELQDGSMRIYENEIRPNLANLKRELDNQAIESAWDGMLTASTYSVAPCAGLVAAGVSEAVALGVGGLLSAAGLSIKSYLARSKARAASPYTYLLDIQRKFSLPK